MPTCKLIIRDECNCKLEGLDLSTRKKLVEKFKYEVPGARYLPAVRLGRWDGKVSYFQLGGSTYINLLPEILPVLDQSGYDVEIDDQRGYATYFEFDQITENSFAHIKWPEKHPMAGEPIVLRDYQVEAINTFLKNPQSVQEISTGAGKTILTAALSLCVESMGRSVVIVPSKSLVTQTETDYRNLQLDVGVFFGDRKEFGHKHTICTWQSLNSLLKNTKNGAAEITIDEFLEGVVCVIGDECHSAKADALKTLLTGAMAHVPVRWGLTGTIPKEDYAKQALLCSLGPVVGKLKASDLQEQGVLANCHVNILQLADYVEYKDYQSELKYLLESEERLTYLANMISNIAETGNTLVLIDRVLPGQILAEKIVGAVFISGATKARDRQEEYDEVATSDQKILVATYGIAAVGINIPRIFNLVLIEPGKSFVRVIQSIGRGIRKSKDKDFVQIWDFTSTCRFAKRHLTTRKKYYAEAAYPHSVKKIEWK